MHERTEASCIKQPFIKEDGDIRRNDPCAATISTCFSVAMEYIHHVQANLERRRLLRLRRPFREQGKLCVGCHRE